MSILYKGKKSRIMVALSLALCMSIMFCGNVFADNSNQANTETFTIPADLETAVIENLSFYGNTGEPTDPVVLYNMNDVPECVAYNISTGGFVYIDVNNFKVLEYCEVGTSEVHQFLAKQRSVPRFYYNGPMNIFYDDGEGTVTHVQTGETYNKGDFTTIFTEAAKPYAATPVTYGTPITGGYLTDYTASWNGNGSGFYCVPTAYGIMLEYYQRVFNYGGAYKYISGSTSQYAVCSMLTGLNGGPTYVSNYKYGIWFADSITGTSESVRACEGMNAYTSNANHYTAPYRFYCSSSFDYDNIVARIKVNKPALLTTRYGILSDIITGPDDGHAVVVVGYRTNPNGDQVLVLNDGWGNSQRYVVRDNRYMKEYIYLQ